MNALTTDSTYDTIAATAANTVASASLGYAYAAGSMSLDPQNPTAATSFTNISRTAAAAITVAPSTSLDDGLQAICGALPAAIARTCATVSYAQDSSGNYLINSYGDVYAIANSTLTPINATQGLGTYQVMQEIGGNKVPGTADLETTVTLTQLYQFAGGSGAINLSYHYNCLLYTSPSPRDP